MAVSKTPATISPSIDVSPWAVMSATGTVTYLPNFQGMPKLATPGRSLKMIRAVNSSVQTVTGDGFPEPGFLMLTGALFAGSSGNGVWDAIDALELVVQSAAKLLFIDNNTVRYWDILLGKNRLDSSNAFLVPARVDVHFAVRRLEPYKGGGIIDGQFATYVAPTIYDGGNSSTTITTIYDGGSSL